MPNETSPHPASAQETALDELLAQDYRSLEAYQPTLLDERSDIAGRMSIFFESTDDDTMGMIADIQEEHATASSVHETFNMPPPPLAEYMDAIAANLPESYMHDVRELDRVTSTLAALQRELESRAPEVAADILSQARALEASIDYAKVAAKLPRERHQQTRSPISVITKARTFLESGKSLTYTQLKSLGWELDDCRYHLDKAGLLAEPAEAALTTNHPDASEWVGGIRANIHNALDLEFAYGMIQPNPVDDGLPEIRGLLSELDQPKVDDPADLYQILHGKYIFNDAYYAAIEQEVVQRLNALPVERFEFDMASTRYKEFVEAARNIDVTEALEQIEITGTLEKLPFEFSEAMLKSFLAETIPPIALAATKRVEFRALTPKEADTDITLGTCGYSKEDEGYVIIISDTMVRNGHQQKQEYYENGEATEAETVTLTKDEALHTIAHEFAHVLHSTLPAAALKQWEDQRVTDPTMVTWYIKSHFDKDSHHKFVEDFSDSAAEFIIRPQILTVTSDTRYQAMRALFEEFMPSYADTLQQAQNRKITTSRINWATLGVSPDTMKRIFLTHETNTANNTNATDSVKHFVFGN